MKTDNHIIADLRDVGVCLGRQPILKGINLKVKKGEFLAVIGPNGAGKTTLVSLVNGIQRPSRGTVRVFGEPLEKRSLGRVRRKTGYVPQAKNIDPRAPVSVYDAVSIGRFGCRGLLRSLNGEDRKSIEKAIVAVGLEGLEKRPVGLLSGGEQQKTALARVLAQEPDIMLLDEPTGSLDIKSQRDIVRIIGDIYREKLITIIYVTHIIDHIPSCCSRAVMMKRGSIVSSGKRKDICSQGALSDLYGFRL